MFAFGAAPESIMSRLASARQEIENMLKMAGSNDRANLQLLMNRQIDLEKQAQVIDSGNADYMGRLDAATDKQLTEVSRANKALYEGGGIPIPDVSRIPSAAPNRQPHSLSQANQELRVPGSTSMLGKVKMAFSNPYLMYGAIAVGGLGIAAVIAKMVGKRSA